MRALPETVAPSSAGREARNAAWNLLALLAQASMPAYSVMVARALGRAGVGLYEWSNKLVFFLSVLTLFGMDQATNRFVALARGRGDPDGVHRAVGTALRVVVASGLLVAALVFAGAPWIAGLRHDPRYVTPLRVLCAVPVFYHVVTVFVTATQAAHVMRYGFWARGVVQPLTLFAVSAAALYLGAGVFGVCVAVLAGMALTAALAAVFYGRVFALGPTLHAALWGPVDRAALRYAAPLVSAAVLTSVLGYADLMIVGLAGLPAEEVGCYAMCLLYAQTLSQVRSTFDPDVLATIPPLLARGDVAALRASLARQTRWSAALAAPLFVLFAGFGDVALQVFGRGFRQGATALALLCVGHGINAISLTPWLLPASGHTRVTARLAVVWAALETGLLLVLVPRYGIDGAAAAAAVGLGGLQVTQGIAAWQRTGVHGYSLALAKTAAAAAAAYVLGRWILVGAPGSLAARFAAGVGVAAVVYLGLLAVTAHPEDLAHAHAAAARARAWLERRGGT